MPKKVHTWTITDEQKLMRAIDDCSILFEHYKNQSMSYSDMNVWDAIAGRLVPDICVTGAACRRRFEQIQSKKFTSGWDNTVKLVLDYEKDLAETTFDGVSELLGNFDALFEVVLKLKKDVEEIKKAWE